MCGRKRAHYSSAMKRRYGSVMKRCSAVIGLVVSLVLVAACHRTETPRATPQDVESAKQEAQRAVAQARIEASKDVKSAAKVTGSHPAEVHEAKVAGSYDVAMVKADGDHKVAIAECLTLQAPMQQGCKDKADADYGKAAAAAKAARAAKQQ